MKIRTCRVQAALSKICPSTIPNQIFTISMHTPRLVKFHWYLLKLSSGNENFDISRADNSVKIWRNWPNNNPKPDLHNNNAHTKFGENSFTFTPVVTRKRKYGRTTDGQTDGHSDSQRDTIIPRHYRVAGYKKEKNLKHLRTTNCSGRNQFPKGLNYMYSVFEEELSWAIFLPEDLSLAFCHFRTLNHILPIDYERSWGVEREGIVFV